MKILALFSLICCLTACSSGDAEMCSCLEAGQKLNDYSAKLMSGNITREKAAELKKLRKDKLAKCKKFELMSGQEMMKKADGCKYMPQTEVKD